MPRAEVRRRDSGEVSAILTCRHDGATRRGRLSSVVRVAFGGRPLICYADHFDSDGSPNDHPRASISPAACAVAALFISFEFKIFTMRAVCLTRWENSWTTNWFTSIRIMRRMSCFSASPRAAVFFRWSVAKTPNDSWVSSRSTMFVDSCASAGHRDSMSGTPSATAASDTRRQGRIRREQ